MSRSHEDFAAHEVAKTSSDRSFGVVFCVVFILIGLFPLVRGASPHGWALGVSAVFALAAALRPSVLAPLNRLWTRLGMLLHHIVNPLVMGVMFFLVVLPTGLVMRALGRDLLRQRIDRAATTYWIDREPVDPDHFKNQF